MRFLVVLILCLAAPLWAEPPRVVTDIAPVQSLVAQVMAGAGEPAVLIPVGASPHDYAMRPSEARSLAQADLVVWIGPGLTPWMADPLRTLAGDARQLVLLGVSGTVMREMREGMMFEAHDHGDEGHEAADPHAWLDPRNGTVWSRAIAEALANLDPPNAALYRQNAETAAEALEVLENEVRALLAPVRSKRFVVLHDAFHYFEARFELTASAAVVDGDAAAPGPARLSDLRQHLHENPVRCAFAEPQTPLALMETVTEGQGVRTMILDPMGRADVPLQDRYAQSLRDMAETIADCLSGQ